jgi:hypothetical protein
MWIVRQSAGDQGNADAIWGDWRTFHLSLIGDFEPLD